MPKKHVNADKNASSQKAKLESARKATQKARGSKKFKSGSNKHHGASISQSGS